MVDHVAQSLYLLSNDVQSYLTIFSSTLRRSLAHTFRLFHYQLLSSAGGVLSDGLLANIDLSSLRRVLAPKASATAISSHHKFQLQPTSQQIFFSSVASLLGSAGQASYSIANAALDATAVSSRASGVPATSIQWGAWAGAGMAANEAVARKVNRLGLGMLQPEAGLAAMERLLCSWGSAGPGGIGLPPAATSAVVPVVPFLWRTFLQRQQQQLRQLQQRSTSASTISLPPLFDNFVSLNPPSAAVSTARSSALKEMPTGSSSRDVAAAAAQQYSRVLGVVMSAVAGVTGSRVAEDEPLMAAGLDSLGAVELRNSLEASLGLQLPGTLVFDFPTSTAVARHVVSRLPALTASTQQLQAGVDSDSDGDEYSQDGTDSESDSGSDDEEVAESGRNAESATSLASVAEQISAQVLAVLGSAVRTDEPLMAAGLDSLASVELRNSLQSLFQLDLSPTLIMDYPSVDALSQTIHARLPQPNLATLGKSGSTAQRRRDPRALRVLRSVAETTLQLRSSSAALISMSTTTAGATLDQDAIGTVPLQRWSPWEQTALNLGSVPPLFGAFLPGDRVAMFDADAFGIGPTEALAMDPHQRLLMQAFADAASPAGLLSGGGGSGVGVRSLKDWGVYVGTSALDYGKLMARYSHASHGVGSYSATGSLSLSVSCGRLSYSFGMSGPSMTVDTACSSALVATHTALASLGLGGMTGAAVGGINLMMVPDTPAMFQKAGKSL